MMDFFKCYFKNLLLKKGHLKNTYKNTSFFHLLYKNTYIELTFLRHQFTFLFFFFSFLYSTRLLKNEFSELTFLKDKLYLKSMVMFTFSKDELYLKSMVVIELFYLVLQSFKKYL